ncbi:extracellular solute-binding protein [Paenibacillus jiagnxiensis]|uniref:extracellular solute-binding protein n=1 Tax=Paenibacillus jiagnxiensis TaxID=3228926 RepID=UPI0033B65563
MTKTFKVLIAALTLCLIVAGCGGSGGSDSGAAGESGSGGGGEKITLSIWHNYSGDDLRAQTMRRLIDEFQQEHPDVTVDSQPIPTDAYRQRIQTVAAAKEMPDLFLTYAGSFTDEFQKAGLIQPITSVLEENKDWADGFLPGATDIYTYDGEVYSAPVAMSATSFLFYNKDIFEQNGVAVPTTWEELLTAIEKFKRAGITPIALGNQAPWVAQSTLFSVLADRVTGSDWFMNAKDGNGASFTEPQFLESLNDFKQLVDAGAFPEGANSLDNTQAEQQFIQGNAAMIMNGAWSISNWAAAASEEQINKVGITVFPAMPNGLGEVNTITGGPGGGFVLNANIEGEKLKLAKELFYKLSNADAQKAIAESNSMVMYNVDIDESKVTPLFYTAFNLVKTLKFSPVYDLYLSAAGGEAINNGLQEIMLGGDPAAVAEKLQTTQAAAAGK